ncbi:START domain-containing protein [Acinetobacter radioresistens]|jgi:ribosome-associated toxin RatA of RatAB toxin-antitoxin module|nr:MULTISPECIES: START domain-containing protein [Acinetobacter]MCX0326876.1 START domain-containing protein [Acinetobacter radioresistens]MCX0332331.1 START domain-containing protein [Acinetobacter radioresistens]MCX0336114.1 START domain-containing protein [Acinetobacter radioresistens]MCX0341876.1 START domain-containing protein [Acinetobacter radioresistens]MCX0344465.1 START domain-containing protein [Acinetobacter radioresistens]
MRKKTIFNICLMLLSLLITQFTSAEQARLKINKQNIKVWTYQMSRNPAASYKAETVFNVPLERAVALIMDVERAQQWVPYMGKISILNRDDQAGEFLLHVVMDLPFPLKDRDLIIQSKITRERNGTVNIRNRGMADSRFSQPDYIRLQDYQGDWTFQRLGANKVKVTTMGYVNPEGSLPISFMNMFVEQQPYQMLKIMRSELERPMYINAKLPVAIQ